MPLPITDVAPIATFLNGDPFDRSLILRIAILSEGFLPNEMQRFRVAADAASNAVQATAPFSRFRDRIGIVRIDCSSRASATVLRPLQVAPANYINKTPFDVRFDLAVARSLTGSRTALKALLKAMPGLPDFDAALILVNNDLVGGAADGDITFLTLNDSSSGTASQVFLHELAHAAFGLADEYEENTGTAREPVHVFTGGTEPVEANITAKRTPALIPWNDLFAPGVLIPTTVLSPASGCVRNKAVRVHVPPLPTTAVGLFEGAKYVSCGLFRSSLTCRMRQVTDNFCPVCDRHIDRRMAARAISASLSVSAPDEQWTHMVAMDPDISGVGTSASFFAAAYHGPSGRFASYSVGDLTMAGAPVLKPRANTAIAGGFTAMAAFSRGTEHFLLLTNLFTNKRAIFRFNPAPLGSTPQPLDPMFETSSAPEAGFSHVVVFRMNSKLFVLHYGRLTGELALEEIDFSSGTPLPQPIASSRAGSLSPWRPLLSGVTTLEIDGAPFIAGIDATNRTIVLAALQAPTGPAPMKVLTETFAAGPEFIRGFQTHATGLSLNGRGRLCLYSALGGGYVIYRPRKGGSGLDHEFGASSPPGAAALFDVGLPAIGGLTQFKNGASRPPVNAIWIYNAGLKRFFVTQLQ